MCERCGVRRIDASTELHGYCSECIASLMQHPDYCDGCKQVWPRPAVRQIDGEYWCPHCATKYYMRGLEQAQQDAKLYTRYEEHTYETY